MVAILASVAIAGWMLALRSPPAGAPGAGNPAPEPASSGAAPVRESRNAARAPPSPDSIAAIASLEGTFGKREALYRLAAGATLKRVRKLIGEAIGLEDVADRLDFLHILFGRYAQDDPGAAVRLLLASDLPGERPELLQAIFGDWARRDVEAALEALQKLDDPHLVQAAGDGMLLAHARPDRLVDRELLNRLPVAYSPGPALAWYLGAYAAHDPEAAALQAAGLYDSVLRRSALHAVANAWAQQDPAAAMAFAATLANSESRWHFEHPVIERWAASDPDALLGALEAAPNASQRQRLLSVALREIVRRDPQKAIAYATASDNRRRRLLFDVLSVLARQDFAGALATAEAHVSGSYRPGALQMIVSSFAEQDPGAALSWALDYDNGTHLASAVRGAARTDSPAAVAFLASLERSALAPHEWDAVVNEIARNDPDRALTLIDRVREGQRGGVLHQIAGQLAERDVQAALEWSATVEPQYRDTALSAVVREWARRDLAAAADYAAGSGDRQLIGAVAPEYARQDHRAAFDWMLSTDGGQDHVHTVIGPWAQEDPAEAAAIVVQHLGEPWAGHALGNVARVWVDRSPDEAIAWLDTLPEDASTTQAIQQAVVGMASRSPEAAVRWARQLTGDSRDHALAAVIGSASLPPDQSIGLANSIENPVQRYSAFQMLVVRGAHKSGLDIGAATQIAADADLTPEQRQQLLELFERQQAARF